MVSAAQVLDVSGIVGFFPKAVTETIERFFQCGALSLWHL
jgi:hypothetical protein